MVIFDLPWDLVEEILFRVSGISLRRLQFTCKRGNTLCNDFIKKHLDKAAKQHSVLMLRNFRVYSLSVNLNEIHNNTVVDPSIEITSKLSRSLNESEQVDITQVFHCNGLLLCSIKEDTKTKLMVVNPCTGQTRWIEPRSVYYDRYVLGYANNNKESYESYKILRFPYDDSQLEIFDLKSNSWRVLDNKNLHTYEKGVSLKGNAYWISYLDDFLSFDFSKERCRRLCLPFPKQNSYVIALSVFREEKLFLLHGSFSGCNTKQIKIWVSNKIDDTKISWSISFTFDLCGQFDHHLHSPVSFLIDEEKKVVVTCGRSVEKNKNMIHIVTEHGCRKFDYDTDQSNHCCPFLFSYVPSLVSLNPPM
ncbi:F-box/LRR-repeat/kelch-repeat protein [Cardamine amara subsp. amara]|uniref:F-box/LRR-repeat/kelch-repeat protein n=1 Tax=Cardamine amara subsp. amara TaxID=228776 RepID=A0ABD1AUS0_CARAN